MDVCLIALILAADTLESLNSVRNLPEVLSL